MLNLLFFNENYTLASVVGYTFCPLFKNSIGLHLSEQRNITVRVQLATQQPFLLILLMDFILTQDSTINILDLPIRLLIY